MGVAECRCLGEPISIISLSAAQFGPGVSSSGTFPVQHLFVPLTVKLWKHAQTEAQFFDEYKSGVSNPPERSEALDHLKFHSTDGVKRLPVSCLLSLIEWGLFSPLQVFQVAIAEQREVCFVGAPLVEARNIPSIDPVGRVFHFLSLNIEQRAEGGGCVGAQL